VIESCAIMAYPVDKGGNRADRQKEEPRIRDEYAWHM
jgi:hypothetical protein